MIPVFLFRPVVDELQTANAVSADYDKIAGFFEDLDSYLSRLKILEHKIPPIAELKEALTEVFTSVLVLCGIWAKYVKMKRIGKYHYYFVLPRKLSRREISPSLFSCA